MSPNQDFGSLLNDYPGPNPTASNEEDNSFGSLLNAAKKAPVARPVTGTVNHGDGDAGNLALQQPTNPGPDINEAPTWVDVIARPEFQSLSAADKAKTKEDYFNYWIAPHAGAQAGVLRQRFLTAHTPAEPQERSWGKAALDTAQNVLAGVAKIGPTALKGAADIGSMITGDAVDLGVSKAMETGMNALDQAIGTRKFNDQKKGFEDVMRDDSKGIGDMFAYMLDNPSILVDNAITTVGSMFLPAGAAKGAVMGARAMGAGTAAASKAAVAASIGSAAAQNAGDTFSSEQLSKLPLEDRYKGAAVSAGVSILMGIATGGGAEGQIAKKLAGDLQAGRVGLDYVKQFLKSVGKEAVQETGEELGNIAGEAVGSLDPMSATGAIKRASFSGTMGGIVGGGTHVVTGGEAGSQPQSTITPDGRIEPSLNPQTPPAAVAPAQTAVHPVVETADAIVSELAQQHGIPLDTVLPTASVTPAQMPDTTPSPPTAAQGSANEVFTDQDVLNFAASRYERLKAQRDGEIQVVMTDDGLDNQVVPGIGLTERDAREMAALEALQGDANALRSVYGFQNQLNEKAPAGQSGKPVKPDSLQPFAGAGEMVQQSTDSVPGIEREANFPLMDELRRESRDTAPSVIQANAETSDTGITFNRQEDSHTEQSASFGDAGVRQAAARDIAALEALYDAANAGSGSDRARVVHPFQWAPESALGGIADIANAFGKRVVGFAVNPAVPNKQFGGFNGVTWPRGTSNRIFINQHADRPHLAVLGHEIAHQFSNNRPDLYARMVDAIRPYIKAKEYGTDFAASAVARNSYVDGATTEQRNNAVREEFIGEVLSDGFMDPDFWRALGQKNKQLLAQVQAFVARIVHKVMTTVGYTPKTERYLNDYARVMKIAGEVMAEYGLNQERLNQAGGLPNFLFVGERAQVTDNAALRDAKRLVEEGQIPEQVRRETGWFRGVDGKWRTEIDDSHARFQDSALRRSDERWGEVHPTLGTLTLGALIDHPALFRAYPELRDIAVGMQPGIGASFNTETGEVKVGDRVPMTQVLSKLLHEVQHAIQSKEGFAQGWNRDATITPAMRDKLMENIAEEGGSPEEATAVMDGQIGRDLTYHWMAGEVESRNVQKRQDMTPEQRLEQAPSETADVSERSQLVASDRSGPKFNASDDLSPRAQREAIEKEFGKAAFARFNWLHKSIGTQYHKAAISPEFRRVFENANAMEAVASLVAVRTAELAPGVLPKVLKLVTASKQLVLGRKAAKEINAATNAILEGTTFGKTVLDGKVWSDDELRSRFKLSEHGIDLYRQMRTSIDAGVFEVAASEIYAMSALYIKRSDRIALRELMIDTPAAGIAKVREHLESSIALSRRIVALQKDSASEHMDSIKEMLHDQEDTLSRIDDVVAFAKALAKVGYAPLMRFGKYTVTVQEIDPSTGHLMRNPNGEPVPTLYFERFETEAEARDAYFNQGARYAGMSDRIRISTGTVNEQEHKLYAGVSPEVVALFAEKIGNKAFEQMLTKLAVSDQSILKRQLNRKNIPGYSKEYDRVLAKFVTSSGRWAASKYYMSDLKKSVKNIRERDVQAEAQKLVSYITNQRVDTGQDVAASVSSLAFTMFLGGPTNVGSAFVNFLQVGTLLPQHLVKTTSTAKAMSAIASAYRAAIGLKELPQDVRAALKKAEQEGKVDAQEVHHLYNIGIQGIQSVVTDYASRLPGVGHAASKALVSARYRLQAAGVLWGAMFGAVESLNRRVTFISAWDVAKSEGIKDPFAYAVNAVDETQGIYTKANRQNLGRNPMGRMLTTFKMVPAMWVEILVRNIKYGGKPGYYAASLQLVTMILLSGIAGLPFNDDLIDIIDTVAQAMGYNWNTKQEREKWAKQTFGQLWGNAVVSGLSAFLPVDMGARLGIANLVPATGVFKKSNVGRRDREVAELFGVGGSLTMMGVDAFDAANAGRMDRAALALAPVAVRNLAQGVEMMATGEARDPITGKRKMSATTSEGAFKAIGFNPQSLAQSGQARFYESQNTALAKVTSEQILNDWAEGIATNDSKLVEKAQTDMEKWNQKNPEYPIYLLPDAIRNKVRQYLLDANQRMIKATPRRWRGTVNENLGLGEAGR